MNRKLWLGLTALAVALAVVLPTTDALAAKTHSVSVTGKVTGVAVQGATNVDVGLFTGSLGETLAVFRTKALSNGKLSSTFTAYTRNGTLKGTALQTPTTNASGAAILTGTAKVIGGTGRYKGATGKLTTSGTEPKGGSVITYKLKGTVRY